MSIFQSAGAAIETLDWFVQSYAPMSYSAGTNVQFVNQGYHDVWKMESEQKMNNCDFSGATKITGSQIYYNTEPEVAYFACSIGGGVHCDSGQKVEITFIETPPLETITWNYGITYSPYFFDTGTAVEFQNSGYHDLWKMESEQKMIACDFSGAIQIIPQTYYNTVDEVAYFACSVGGGWHCNNGQQLKITFASLTPSPTAALSNAPSPADPTISWTEQLRFDDFEDGWGSYKRGGSRARLWKKGGDNTLGDGMVSMFVSDDLGEASSAFTKKNIEVSGFDRIKVTFGYRVVKFSRGEKFSVKYKKKGSSSWVTAKTYKKGRDFSSLKEWYNEEVIIDVTEIDLLKIGFFCDASSRKDKVFLDQIDITGGVVE